MKIIDWTKDSSSVEVSFQLLNWDFFCIVQPLSQFCKVVKGMLYKPTVFLMLWIWFFLMLLEAVTV